MFTWYKKAPGSKYPIVSNIKKQTKPCYHVKAEEGISSNGNSAASLESRGSLKATQRRLVGGSHTDWSWEKEEVPLGTDTVEVKVRKLRSDGSDLLNKLGHTGWKQFEKEENREGMEYRKCVLDLDKSSSLPTFHPLEVCGITCSLVSMSWCADIW